MNQDNLYATLNYEGCKILSFEDFPSNFGSWRVHFLLENMSCMVTVNRADNILMLTSKSNVYGNQCLTLSSMDLVTEQLEITRVAQWIKSLTKKNKFNRNLKTNLDVGYLQPTYL